MMRPSGRGSYLMDVSFENGRAQASLWIVGQRKTCVPMVGDYSLGSENLKNGRISVEQMEAELSTMEPGI